MFTASILPPQDPPGLMGWSGLGTGKRDQKKDLWPGFGIRKRDQRKGPPSWKDTSEFKPPQPGSHFFLSPLHCVLGASHKPSVRDVFCVILPVSLPRMHYPFSPPSSIPQDPELKFSKFLSLVHVAHTSAPLSCHGLSWFLPFVPMPSTSLPRAMASPLPSLLPAISDRDHAVTLVMTHSASQ